MRITARPGSRPQASTKAAIELKNMPPASVSTRITTEFVNVGGMTFKQGTKALSQAVYISDEDVKAFQEIDRRGVTQYIQQVPSTGRTDLMSALKSKGFIS